MDKRHGGIALPALLAGACLAAALGCGGGGTRDRPTLSGFSPAQAKAGDTVVISGTSFDGTTAVSFEGAPAAGYKAQGNFVITATVPADAVTGYITVANPAGIASSTQKLTVAPVIASLEPDHGPAGTTVTVTGSGLMGVTALAIGGDPSSSFTPYYSPTQVMLVVGAGAVTGPVTLTASGVGCTGPQFTVEP